MFFLVIGEDKPDALALRHRVRVAHLDYVFGDVSPVILLGGSAFLDEAGGDMAGSWFLLEAPDREALQIFLDNDPYARAGVFARVVVRCLSDVSFRVARLRDRINHHYPG